MAAAAAPAPATDAVQAPVQPHIHDLLAAEEDGKLYYSFEYFPPRTDKGEETLRRLMTGFARQKPIFVDFTWGAGGTTAGKTPEWCMHCIKEHGLVANMHLTCTNMPEGKVHEALTFCVENGIRNLVALRGDPPAGEAWKECKEGFSCGLDLVKYIRQHYGDYFSIAVAGYPEGHPDKIDAGAGVATPEVRASEIAYLKQKVDAGANYIITQLFYDPELFFKFVDEARAAGIQCPIIPGILPPVTKAGLARMVTLCKTFIPATVAQRSEACKDDDEFKAYGVEFISEMCKALKERGHVKHLHFYTLNLDHSTFRVLENLGGFVPAPSE